MRQGLLCMIEGALPGYEDRAPATPEPARPPSAATSSPSPAAARHGRGGLTLHLPDGWHLDREWLNLFEAACGPSAVAA
jgi:hypothetical protein